MNSAPASDRPSQPQTETTATPEPASSSPRRWPWQSAAVGWLVAAVIAVAGVPLFLRMPLWIDVTLYDVAARNILRGGVHYRDVFDTNPPGFVLTLSALRSILGPSIEAVRAVDLAVVAAVVWLLLRWARAGGASAAAVAWAAAGVAGFYLFISEFNHAQRDVWMMLPAITAASYRVGRVRRACGMTTCDGWVFRTALLEGVVWGLAAWVKPHVVLMAAAMWAVTQPRLAGSAGVRIGPRLRRSAADLAGSVLGGLIVGAAGVAWLVGSGTWPHFVKVFTEWNTTYAAQMWSEFGDRADTQLLYFPPWSLLIFFAAPLAVLNAIDGRLWSGRQTPALSPGPVGRWFPAWVYDRAPTDDARFARATLAALYLAWAVVALVVQKNYHYVHVPETMLMLAVFAANRWAVVAPVLLFQAGVMAWLAATDSVSPPWPDRPLAFRCLVWQYPDREPNRFRWWPGCFARTVPGELRNGVAFQSDFFAGIDWRELDEVAEYLRERGVKDGEVMCWNDSTHPLYLILDVRPPIRFMHLSTAVGIGPTQYEWVKAEVTAAAPRCRFVVSDLRRLSLFYPPEDRARMSEPGVAPDHFPPVVPGIARHAFPLNQPTVFRSGNGRGRYIVHRMDLTVNPVGEVYVP